MTIDIEEMNKTNLLYYLLHLVDPDISYKRIWQKKDARFAASYQDDDWTVNANMLLQRCPPKRVDVFNRRARVIDESPSQVTSVREWTEYTTWLEQQAIVTLDLGKNTVDLNEYVKLIRTKVPLSVEATAFCGAADDDRLELIAEAVASLTTKPITINDSEKDYTPIIQNIFECIMQQKEYKLHGGGFLSTRDNKPMPRGAAKVHDIIRKFYLDDDKPTLDKADFNLMVAEIEAAIGSKQAKHSGFLGWGARDESTAELYRTIISNLDQFDPDKANKYTA